MIVAISLDPAVHVSYETKRVVPGTTHQVGRVRYRVGGRGPAVARMLHTFGHEVVAAGLAGGTAGELIRAELARVGVPTQFTPIAMESRRVVEVTDASAGTTTSFAEPSPYITTEELGRLAADYRSLIDGASAAVLCGGLPDGLPPETYATFATYAAEAGVPVVLDAGGSALWHGAARGPALVIPEPATDTGEPGAGEPGTAGCGEGAGDPARLMAAGAGAVALMPGETVTVITESGQWRARLAGGGAPGGGAPGSWTPFTGTLGNGAPGNGVPGDGAPGDGAPGDGAPGDGAPGDGAPGDGAPGDGAPGDGAPGDGAPGGGMAGGRVPAMSRDALVAGFVPGVALGWSWPDSLRHAVSLAATAGLAGEIDLVTYERLLPEVIIEALDR
jgi:tagatose 6-phosphate kinase